jgi:hypothetical protein
MNTHFDMQFSRAILTQEVKRLTECLTWQGLEILTTIHIINKLASQWLFQQFIWAILETNHLVHTLLTCQLHHESKQV